MHSSHNTIKILVIGPVQSGQSTIANFIAQRTESTGSAYRPTTGVRILQFEREAPQNPKRPGAGKVLVELWDISGDTKYDRCWPAVQKGAHGIMLVYNADNPKHENELESWVANFPKKCGVPASLCIGFAHHLGGKPIKGKSKPPKGLGNLQLFDTSIEEGTSTIHPCFDKFFNNLMTHIYDKEQKEESNILKD